MGTVDADAPPTSEKLSPAAPSAFTAAVFVLRFFCFEACLTRGMAASSVVLVKSPANRAPGETGAQEYLCQKSGTSYWVPFIFMKKARIVKLGGGLFAKGVANREEALERAENCGQCSPNSLVLARRHRQAGACRVWDDEARQDLVPEKESTTKLSMMRLGQKDGLIRVIYGVRTSNWRRFEFHFERGRAMKSPIVKRSIVLNGHKTSVSLEEAFWSSMKEISAGRGMTLTELVSEIETNRHEGNMSSAIRLFVLDQFKSCAASPAG